MLDSSLTVQFCRHLAHLARPTRRRQLSFSSFCACVAKAAQPHQRATFSSVSADVSSRARSIQNQNQGPDNASTQRKDKKRSKSKHSDNVNNDWRAWFRSFDYDDPWSPYYPLEPKLHHNNDNADYQNIIVPSVLDGTWERRRHGMNLEPLLCKKRSQHNN